MSTVVTSVRDQPLVLLGLFLDAAVFEAPRQ